MTRFIKIKGAIKLYTYDWDSWELIIKITPEDVELFCMELNLLWFGKAEAVIIESLETGEKVTLTAPETLDEARVCMKKDDYRIEFSDRDIQAILSYLLEYYRDSFAPVSHMHIEVNDDTLGEDGDITIVATRSAEQLAKKSDD